MRDIDTIDGEPRLPVAICNMVREVEGHTPNTAYIDGLLYERGGHLRNAKGRDAS
jgi:hypothetical protein